MKTNFKFNRQIASKTSFFLLILLVCVLLTGCGKNTSVPEKNDTRIQIVAETFASYDWTKELLGDNPGNIRLSLLLDNGVDLHSYNPSIADIALISSCDMFIYTGGESDAWAKDVLQEAVKNDMISLNLLEILGDNALEEELTEGMKGESGEEEEGEGPESDEHVWLSLKNASLYTEKICDALCLLDSQNSDYYRSRKDNYCEQLAELDRAYESAVTASPHDTLLFADRFPFRYLTEDYHLTYYAAFPGCSAESEAGFSTIAFLANKAEQLNLPVLLIIDNTSPRIATVVRDNTTKKDQKILSLNSMQALSTKDSAKGITYLSVMEDNLDILKIALQ